MWVDDKRVAHTAAPTDWREVIHVSGVPGEEPPASLLDTIEQHRLAIFRRIETGEIGPGGSVGKLPEVAITVPAEVLKQPALLGEFIGRVDKWWQLDVLDAIEESIEEPE